MREAPVPFCSQPWTTLYVQWDGKITRPCIRGPQDLGSLDHVDDIAAFWNGETYRERRRQIRHANDLIEPCSLCFADRGRLIEHLAPFLSSIESFDEHKQRNYFAAIGAHAVGAIKAPSRPVVIILDISSKCNVRCPKCFVYNSDLQYKLGHMTMETINKVAPLFETALLVVGHENGESILNKNFLEIVKIIKSNGCRFTFNTTGQTLTREKSEALVSLGVDQIMFSIDSVEEELYARMHKGGALARLLTNLETLNEVKAKHASRTPLLGWYLVACRSNLAEIDAIVETARRLGFSSMFVSHLNGPTREQQQSYFDYYDSENMKGSEPDKAQFRAGLSLARRMAEGYGLEYFQGAFD